MGRFEDLIELAKTDPSALDTLESEFGGSTLRTKAEEADSLRDRLAAQNPLALKGRFMELSGELSEELSGTGLTVEDLGDMDPSELTLDFLKDKAQARLDQRVAAQTVAAKEAGFETVEEYQSALTSLKQNQVARQQNLESVGGSIGSGGGGPVVTDGETPVDAMFRDYDKALDLGATTDVALGEGLHGLMAAQRPVRLEE